MIVRRIEVEAFRRFVDRRSVELDPTKINVVHGPNGRGKSTLLEAMRFGFLRSHKAGGADVTEVVPWGRELGPKVAIEFEADGRRYRAEKQYLHGASAKLMEWRDGRFEAVSEGPSAEEKLRLFAGMRPGFDKGAKGTDEFWTSVLWSPQGALELQSIDGSVLEQVRASLGAQMESGVVRRVIAEVAQLANVNWTPSKEDLKKGSPVRAIEERLAELARQIDTNRAELSEMDRLRAEIAALGASITEIEATHAERLREQESLGADLDKVHALEQQIALEAKSLEQASLQDRTVRQELERRRAAEERLAELTGQLERSSLRRVRAGEPSAAKERKERLSAMWSETLRYVQGRKERDALAGRVREAEEAAARVKAIDEALAALQAPSRQRLDALTSLRAKIERLEAQLESALLHVEFSAERALDLEVLEGEPGGPRSMQAGERLTISGSPAVRVRVEGVGEWNATGPAGSVSQIREELSRARAEWGAADLEELRRRREQADELERERIERGTSALSYLALAQQLESMSEACSRSEGRFPEWRNAAPDADAIALELRAAEQAEAEAREAESEWKRLSESEVPLRKDLDTMQALAELESKANAAAVQARRIELNLGDLREQREKLPAGLSERGAQLESEIARFAGAMDEARQRRAERTGSLAEKAARTPYATLTKAEEESEELRVKYERERLRAEAALLLRKTLNAAKQEMLESSAGEVGRAATALLEEITGTRLGDVELSADLAPAGLCPESLGDAVDLGQLSGGELEQVHFATRLALADILCRDEPGLVVFDDALMATDDDRLRQILAMLEARTAKMQVLILTCHPERYSPFRDANLISLA